jgi:hypothetical protein
MYPNKSRRVYQLRPSQIKYQEEKKMLFKLRDGTAVFRGDTLYVHPSFIKRAGLTLTAEFKPEGGTVVARSENGGVTSLPVNLLSKTPYPIMEIKSLISKSLNIDIWEVTERDVSIYKLGKRLAGTESNG